MKKKNLFSKSGILLRSEGGPLLIGIITFLTLLALMILIRYEFSSKEESMHVGTDNLILPTPPNWFVTGEAYPWLYPVLIGLALCILVIVSLVIYSHYLYCKDYCEKKYTSK